MSTYVSNPDDNIGKAPLEMVYCADCTLAQLKHSAKPELLYSGHYWYRSGLNKVIIDDLKQIVNEVLAYTTKFPIHNWIDIGANDGTLLSFVSKGVNRIGVEPASNLQEELAKNCDEQLKIFWEDYDGPKAEVITAIGMFYDTEEPMKFVAKVKEKLADDGIFIAQLMTSKSMLEKNDVGNICHEHIEYYSYESLKYLFENNGLEIFRVEENSINGGSYRLYARHYTQPSVHHSERTSFLDYLVFYSHILKNKLDCIKFIREKNAEGKKIYGYGASTKGNTILQWYGLGAQDIRGIAEIHPEKFGKFTVGSKIPIIKEEEAKADADYLFVMPYAFRDAFIKREAEWISNGGKFIFATPEFEIYG